MFGTQTPHPNTPVTPTTAIHLPETPNAPKKEQLKLPEFLKPSVYKPVAGEQSGASKALLKALSDAGVQKTPSLNKDTVDIPQPAPRKPTISIIDGHTGSMIKKYVPSHLFMHMSSHAAIVLGPKPWAGEYKVYGKYDRAAMKSVINAVIKSEDMPVATELEVNLSTYEACRRIGISSSHPCVKSLLDTIYAQISKGPATSQVISFVTDRLGVYDVLFNHLANVLCYQRYKGQVENPKAFRNMVTRNPALQKKMVQIDQAHKAQREAARASKREDDKRVGIAPAVTGVEELEAKLKLEREAGVQQKEKLLRLLKGWPKSVPGNADGKVEEKEDTLHSKVEKNVD